MASIEKRYGLREYNANEVAWFRKTKEAFGGLSNMCGGYPLIINGHHIRSSEALYQACRFPDLPDVQRVIINEKSPMTAKMKSKPHRIHTREDWDNVRVAIMEWSIRVKLAQNFHKFGQLLEESYSKQIVEDSRKDRFWGAVREKDNNNKLIGINALGRLLMGLRKEYMSSNKYDLLLVKPLRIKNFKLFGEEIQIVDERINFAKSLVNYWGLDNYYTIHSKNGITPQKNIEIVQEPLFNTLQNKVSKPIEIKEQEENEYLKGKILLILKYGKAFSSKEMIKRLRLDWETRDMTSFLKKINTIEVVKGSPLKFKMKQQSPQSSLF